MEDASAIAPDLQRPLEAYDHATETPVYRLSELMFVGLLAAYVLGFVTFASDTASLLTNPDIIRDWNWQDWRVIAKHIIVRSPYLCVSLTYAYITAGIYVSYHTGILTMPDRADNQLSWDFLLALSPAIFFGASMLYPFLFPAFLGIVLLAAASRQYVGYLKLTEKLWEKLSDKRDKKDGINHLRGEWGGIIKDYESFSTWKRASFWILFFAFVLLALNVAMWWFVYYFSLPPSQGDQELNQLKSVIVFGVSILIVGSTVLYAKGALGEKAGLMFGRMRKAGSNNLDTRFNNLLKRVKETIDEHQRKRDSN